MSARSPTVPQMFPFAGTSRFRNPQNYRETIGGGLSFVSETRGFAKFILKERPHAKIAVLYQNDDYGKDHLNGLKAALGEGEDDDNCRGVLRSCVRFAYNGSQRVTPDRHSR